MAEEIQKFDPSQLADKVRERIRLTVADLVPEEAWQKMVEFEIKRFTAEEQVSLYGGGVHVRPSPLGVLVRDELTLKIKALVRAEFDSPAWATYWDGTRQVVGSEVTKLAKEMAPELLEAMLRELMKNTIAIMKGGL